MSKEWKDGEFIVSSIFTLHGIENHINVDTELVYSNDSNLVSIISEDMEYVFVRENDIAVYCYKTLKHGEEYKFVIENLKSLHRAAVRAAHEHNGVKSCGYCVIGENK